MTTAIIVQARMHSTRLPGKVLLELGGKTVLHHVLTRCQAVKGADAVVCAIPDGTDCAPIAAEAEMSGARVVRGSEHDVLDRYVRAAYAVKADVIMRVTSDCPLIDPQVCADVLALRARESADYACNNMPPSFPHGLDCEAFTTAALEVSAAATNDPRDREHVTPWLRRGSDVKRTRLSTASREFVSQRWTLDYPEDYEFFRAVWAMLPEREIRSWRDVAILIAGNPDLAAINASRVQERTR